ncbi:MAG TPA: PQQ-binding-like beta-propeller repeat protein [Phycisphaerae bacterium]|nr:PQQ-binding-like beta-propeller repeat protein [Phycisphaerae bacterium]HUT60928.1 PQQ-binding-like beta-propeller repeat protein [Phycisphaerae bacterium]
MRRLGTRTICTAAALAVAGVALALAIDMAAAPSAAADWPSFHGPNGNGISDETDWKSDWSGGAPKQAWKKNVGTGYSMVAVVGDKLYTMGNANNTDTVWCLNAKTGDEIWKSEYACRSPKANPGPRCTPTVDGGLVYTLSRAGDMRCMDAAKGDLKWQKRAREFGGKAGSWGFAGSALIVGDMVIFDVGTVVALNKTSGEVIWKTPGHKAGYATPAPITVDGKKLLATFNADGLALLELASGKELRLYPWKTSYDVNAPRPIYVDGKVFICSGYGKGCGLVDVKAERMVYQKKIMASHFTTPILYKGLLYGIGGQAGAKAGVVCLDPATGEAKWSSKAVFTGGLMLADGKLIIQDGKGELVIAEASPDGYKELARTKVLSGICWNMPVLSNGMIYCRNDQGDMVAVDVSGK